MRHMATFEMKNSKPVVFAALMRSTHDGEIIVDSTTNQREKRNI